MYQNHWLILLEKITSFSGLLGVSKEDALNLVINWIRPQIKGKILSYQTFSFGA